MGLIDAAAERAVLVGLLQYGEDAYMDVADFLSVDSFTDPVNQAVFKCITYLCEHKEIVSFDQASILACASELGYTKLLDKPVDVQHLRSLFNGMVKLENVRKWAGQIRKLQIARLLKSQLEQASLTLEDISGSESIDAIINIAEGAIFDFSECLHGDNTSVPSRLSDGIDAFLDAIEANPVDIVGISSGFPYYDQSIGGGFRRKTVSLMGARSKVGKSFVALTIALHVARVLGIKVLYLDTEMSKEDHWGRLLPNLCLEYGAKVTINELETGSYVKNDLKRHKVREAAKSINGLPLDYLNVSGKPFEETLSIMRRWVNKEVGVDENGRRNDCLIIYDYLKLMSGEGLNESLKEYQIMGFITTSLHNFGVRHDVPIFTMVQLNRDGIDRENTDVISASDRILWLVTNFSIFKNKTPEEIAQDGPENGNRKLVPISARHGEGLEPGDYININFIGKYGRLVEGETHLNLKRQQNNGSSSNTSENQPDNE